MSTEFERVAALSQRFAALENVRTIVPIGDDAAVVLPDGAVNVTSVDAINDGVHFVRGVWPTRAIGRKAVAAALSDLAAMAARPGEVYVAAGLPADLGDEEFDELCAGMAEAAEASGATIAGGDMVAAGQLWLSVTVVGYADSAKHVVTRGGAQAGDVVVVTGELGAARQALRWLTPPYGEIDLDAPDYAKLFNPQPRFAAAHALFESGASAMIDLSDGLAGDAGHIAAASNVEVAIELHLVPAVDWPGGESRGGAFAAESGEEYELLATLPEAMLDEAARAVGATGVKLTPIGRVNRPPASGSGVRFVGADGAVAQLRGFDHFD